MGQLSKPKNKAEEKEEALKAQALEREMEVEEYLAEILKSMTPMPGFIQRSLQKYAEGSKISVDEVALFHIVHSMAVLGAQVSLTKSTLLNPFIDFEGDGLVNNWLELYVWLKYEWERFFLASNLLVDEEKKE